MEQPEATLLNDGLLSQIPVNHIREAALRVASTLPIGEDGDQACTDLAAVGLAVANRVEDPFAEVDWPQASPSAHHLLSALCLEVMRGWACSPPSLGLEVIAPTCDAFESLAVGSAPLAGERISPAWDVDFAAQLSGPAALNLVVEVAHDLRSPLTSILFLAETLQRGQSGPVSELQHRQLGLIYSAALGLSTLASNVLELARGGNQLSDDHSAPFSVRDVMESVADIVRPMAEEKGLSVRLLPPTLDHRVGPAQALSRVLLNLTTNAIKFTEEGFVELVAKAKDLEAIEFSVRDTGPGISAEAMDTLFQPFRRAPQAEGRAFSGTGLGLALCRKLVEIMGSTLRFETGPGWGTRFYFDLSVPPAKQA